MTSHQPTTSMPMALAAIGLALCASSPRAVTLQVTESRDAVDAAPGDGRCATVDGACTLRAAVQEANALYGGDEIRLPAGRFALELPGQDEDGALTGDLDVLDDLTIGGAGAGLTLVDAARLDRAFDVPCGPRPIRLVMHDVAIGNGSRGCVRVLGPAELELTDSRIASGQSASAGGNLYLRGAKATLTRSVIRDGAASWQGGGIAVHGGTIDLVDCVLSGNRGPLGAGLFACRGAHVTIAGERPADDVLVAEPNPGIPTEPTVLLARR